MTVFNPEHSQPSPVDDARWAAHQAGAQVIRFRTDGSKAPIGREWQLSHPNDDAVREMQGWPNFGIVCGEIQCLEFEGRFGGLDQAADRLRRAGLDGLFTTWINGYCEQTPSGGLHILVRLITDDPPGNTKIALDADHETLIETRGYHGAVICAPSNGPTHESGKPWTLVAGSWETLAAVTMDEWYAVQRVLASFDEQPPAPPPPPLARPAFAGEGWINAALAQLPDLATAMVAVDWTYVRSDPLGQLWRRPGKSTGISARLNQSGRLHVFSTSTPLPQSGPTYDSLDVVLAYRLGRVPTLDERTAELRQYKPLTLVEGQGQRQLQHTALPDGAGGHHPATSSLNRPDEYWQGYSFLDHVWRAALSRGCSPDTVWEAVKWGFAANVPFNFLLPDQGTFDYTAVMVGASGAGKSRSKSVGLELLGPRFMEAPGVGLPIPPGTGEGMSEFFIRRNTKGHQQSEDPYRNRGAGYYVDEGELILRLRERAGSTLISSMKSAWSGELMGQTNASQDKTRHLQPRAVRNAVLISVTIDDGAQFLATDLSDGGFPQRITWSWAHYSNWPRDRRPPWPGPLEIPHYPWHHWGMGQLISVDDEIATVIADAQDELTRSPVAELGLEGHSVYSRLKIAGLLALMDGRFNVNAHDWEWAGVDLATSRNVRAYVGELAHQHVQDRYERAGQASAVRAKAEIGFWMNEAVQKLLRIIDSCDGLATTKPVQSGLKNYRTRQGIRYQEIIEHAESLGLVIWDRGKGVRRAR